MHLSARHWLIVILIATAAVYAASIGNGFVNLDDPLLVTENARVQNASFENIGYVLTHFDPELYIPVTFLTYQAETWLLGPDAWHFHVFAILLHLACVCLVFAIVRRIARHDGIALLTAAIVALHPLNAETVLWVSARKDQLSSFFFLASLLGFLRYEETSKSRWYWISFAAFVLAAFSKVTAVTLPVLLVLLAGKPKNLQSSLRRFGPFFGVAIIAGAIAMLGKSLVESHFVITDLLFMAFRSTFFYLKLFVLPTGQSAIHALDPQELYSPTLLISIVTVGAIVWALWKARSVAPLACAGFAFFLLSIAPSFLHYTRGNETFMLGSERYAYLPSIGISLAVASIVMLGWKQLHTPWLRASAAVCGVLILCVLGYLTVLRTFIFEDAIIFSVDILQKNPHDSRTWYNLGIALEEQKRPMEAEEAYAKALEAKPDLANAAINLGLLFLREGRKDEGMAMLVKSTEMRPDYFKGFYNLGIAYEEYGNFAEAEKAYRKTVELFPDFPAARRSLATILGKQKKFAEAIEQYEALALIDPGFRAELENLKKAR